MAITDLIATIFISLLVFVLVISYFIIKFKVVDYETEIQKNQKEIRDLNEKISKLKARKPRKKEIKKVSKEYLQLDIFGEAKPLSEVISSTKPLSHGGRITKKSLFRSINGYKNGFYCKNCKHFKELRCNRKYFKCEILGITSSEATDIRKNDIACNLYE